MRKLYTISIVTWFLLLGLLIFTGIWTFFVDPSEDYLIVFTYFFIAFTFPYGFVFMIVAQAIGILTHNEILNGIVAAVCYVAPVLLAYCQWFVWPKRIYRKYQAANSNRELDRK